MSVHAKLYAELQKWQGVLALSGEMPFVVALNPVVSKVREIVAKPAMALYADEIVAMYDPLLDLKEGEIDRVLHIATGTQKTTFIEARKFAHEKEANFRKMQEWGGTWLTAATKFQNLLALVDSVEIHKNAGMVQVTSLFRELKTDLNTALEHARAEAVAKIDAKVADIKNLPEYPEATDAVKTEVETTTSGVKSRIADEQLISAIESAAENYATRTYIELMNKVLASAQPPEPQPEPGNPTPTPAPTQMVVAYATVVRGYDKTMISSEAEIDAYLAFLRQKLKTVIAGGKRIAIA